MRVLSPTAILGYGYPLESFEAGLAADPDLIAVDAGSTDPGPYYLGAGVSFTDRAAVLRDLRPLLRAARARGIPLLIGTGGGSGAAGHLQWCGEILREAAALEGVTARLATIPADIPKEFVREKMRRGLIRPLGPAPPLGEDDLAATTAIVAQMGMAPFQKALAGGAEVVLAGRAYDPAPFAALPVQAGLPVGLAVHMGKILECAAIAASPGSGSDCMLAALERDSFIVEPTNKARRCTITSVAAHTLYEKSDPTHLPGPDGVLDLSDCHFEAVSSGAVRVTGSRFVPAAEPWLKLEGARRIGFRTIAVAGVRDPIMIRAMEEVTAGVKQRTADNFRDLAAEDYALRFIVYGRDGVMAELEPERGTAGHELGIIIEVVARSQAQADTICSFARSTMLHFGYQGRKATAGNLAFPFSPSDFHGGPVYRFSLHHLMLVEPGDDLFQPEFSDLGQPNSPPRSPSLCAVK